MICSSCKNVFSPNTNWQRFCSKKCCSRERSRRQRAKQGRKRFPLGEKQCLHCLIIYKQNFRKQKYCTYKCSSDAKKKFLDIPICLDSASRKIDKTLGYVRVYAPMHKEANTWGYVYEHRVVAEQMIGRDLLPKEIVHHKNGVRWDNRKENLEVMMASDHAKLHGQREEDLGI